MPIGMVSDKMHGSVAWLRASKGGRALWASALSWCAAHSRFDGHVPRHMLRTLGGTAKDAQSLVDCGLWTIVGDDFVGTYELRRNDRRSEIPDVVRIAVYERDGFACVRCGATSSLSLDHIEPWSLGGSDAMGNLQTMCKPCNSSKGASY